MNRRIKIALLFLGFLGLISIRTYASVLFYDPLIGFFESSYHTGQLPDFDLLGLTLNTSLRFWMNSLLSLFILWLLFENKEVVQLSLWLYALSFLLLICIFYYLLAYYDSGSYMSLFYARRFLIQPILLLVLIPAFYFHKLSK